MRVCMEWDKAAELARGGGLTAVQARKVLSEMVAVATGESLCQFSVEEWFGQWLSSKTGSTAPSTLSRYRQVTDDFLVSLGARAKNPLAGVTPGDVTQFRDALRKEGRAVSSVNVTVKKILSLPFEAARRMGYIPSNPVAGVDGLKDREEKRTGGRDPFTHDEVCRLVKACDAASDWRGAIILAATTGLRLGDVANLTWSSVDAKAGLLRVETGKTGIVVSPPMHPDFVEWLAKRTKSRGEAPVFPSLAGRGTGGRQGLSAEFRSIMKSAKIDLRTVQRKGAGRTTFSKGFHSLRHSFISGLANLGVSAEIRQTLAGHVDVKTHAGYTHHEKKVLRAAIHKLPRIE